MNDIQYCPNCGKRIGEDGAARFCKYCGSSLTTDACEELGSAQPSLPETDESVNPPLSQSAMPSLNKADVPKSRIPSLNYSERHRRNRRAFLIGSSVLLSLLAIVLLTTARTDDYQPEEPPSAASTENQAQPSQPQPTTVSHDSVAEKSEPTALNKAIAAADDAQSFDLYDLFNLDVIDFYGLADQYATDLQKETFKQSPAYRDKLNSMKADRDAAKGKKYYVKWGSFQNESFDVNSGGFNFQIGTDVAWTNPDPPKTLPVPDDNNRFFWFASLPTHTDRVSPPILTKPSAAQVQDIYYLSLKMSRTAALNLENNSAAKIIFLFNVVGVRKVFYRGFSSVDGQWMQWSTKLLECRHLRIIVANEQTGEIYFDKRYGS